MKIAILGCGYVGRALAQYWKSQGHLLTVSVRSQEKALDLASLADRIDLLVGNDRPAVERLIQDQDVLAVCIAADSPSAYRSTYLETAQTLVQVVPQHKQLKQILYTSSTSVYGDAQGKIVDEETPLTPLHETSRILAEAEQNFRSLIAPSRNVCILRLGEIYGPGRALKEKLRRLNGGILPGSGLSPVNLTHLDDIIAAMDLALNKSLNGIYNVCGDMHLPRKELYALICHREGLPPVTWDINSSSIHGGSKIVSNAKLKQAGYSPKTNLHFD